MHSEQLKISTAQAVSAITPLSLPAAGEGDAHFRLEPDCFGPLFEIYDTNQWGVRSCMQHRDRRLTVITRRGGQGAIISLKSRSLEGDTCGGIRRSGYIMYLIHDLTLCLVSAVGGFSLLIITA